jgi:hypothetical protein
MFYCTAWTKISKQGKTCAEVSTLDVGYFFVPCNYTQNKTAQLKVKNSVLTTFSGLYYKLIMILNDNSSIVNKLETSLIDDTRVVIYYHHMFIVQATGSLQFAFVLPGLIW